MQAQTDETLLSELAERFDIDTQTLLLFMNCTTVSYEATTLTSGSSLIETNTPEYNLIVNGKNYVAFSLDKTKTRTAGVNYSQKTSVSSTWNDWLKGTLSTPYTTSYWLINAVSYAASYYTNDTWISRTMTLFGCTSEQAKPILRAAIQQVIWYWTNYAKYPEIQGTTLYTLAKEIETASYKASYYMPDPFNWNWYVPVSTGYNNAVNISNSPNLLVATTGGDTSIDGMYVGYSGEAARAENPNVSTEKLYVTSFENYVTASSAADRIAKSQIAYCFNYDLHYPYSNMYGGWSAGTADDYNLYTETTDSNFATDKIMAIALNGYPNNASGFYTGQVTEGAFYLVTQYAIWYYTDNYVWEKAQERLSADEYTLYTNLLNSNLSTTLQNIKNKNANPESVEANINLYVTSRYAYNLSTGQYDENSATDKGFQNLLTVGLLSDAFNLPDGTLTISKTVTGDTANMPSNSTFTSEVVLT
jgi:TQXA domain-containing protein